MRVGTRGRVVLGATLVVVVLDAVLDIFVEGNFLTVVVEDDARGFRAIGVGLVSSLGFDAFAVFPIGFLASVADVGRAVVVFEATFVRVVAEETLLAVVLVGFDAGTFCAIGLAFTLVVDGFAAAIGA